MLQDCGPEIRINGKQALGDLIYKGILQADLKSVPRIYEQGHDHLELIGTDGRGKITKRILNSASLGESPVE